jgi:hypothetical protein
VLTRITTSIWQSRKKSKKLFCVLIKQTLKKFIPATKLENP